MVVAHWLLAILATYAACGLVFAMLFVVAGVTRVDRAANGAPLGFRLLIVPGSVMFWPVLAVKWWRAWSTRSDS